MATCYHTMERHGDALPLYVECREGMGRMLGKDHPDYLSCINNMANCYKAMGRHGDALPLYVECRNGMGRVLGKDHPDYLSCINNMANCYKAMDRHGDALPLYVECREGRGRVPGKDHPEYFRSCLAVALSHLRLGDPAAGLEPALEGRDGLRRTGCDSGLLQASEGLLSRL